jgi:hypothetical protein
LGASTQGRADLVTVSSDTEQFGTLDTVTGIFTATGTTSPSFFDEITRVGGSTIFGIDSGTNLRTIQPNGSSTFVGTSGNSILAIAQRQADAQLFGVSFSGSASLFTVNSGTGAAALVGPLGIGTTWYATVFDNLGDLFLVNAPGGRGTNSNLYSINTVTGAATLIGPVGTGGNTMNVDSLDFQNGVLYGFTDSTDATVGLRQHIITINTVTGVGTDTGVSYATNGLTNIFGSVPAAVSPVPEPPSLLLCGLAAGGALAYAWRRRQAVA